MRMQVQSLALLCGLRIQSYHELWRSLQTRCGSRIALLWLWCRPAAATPIHPLAWEAPHAAGAAFKSKKEKRNTKTSPAIQILLIWGSKALNVDIGLCKVSDRAPPGP